MYYICYLVYYQVYDPILRIGEKKMRLRTKLVACGVVMVLVVMIGFSTIPQAQAQFVIADYTYSTTNYGNSIAYIHAYIDSEFNASMYKDPDSYPGESVTNPLEVAGGVNITLAVFCWVNGTVTGISSLSEGLTIMRHRVTVTGQNGTTIFSQQNFTYIIGSDGDAPMYFFRHDVILDFVPVQGQIYTATVVYEVFY